MERGKTVATNWKSVLSLDRLASAIRAGSFFALWLVVFAGLVMISIPWTSTPAYHDAVLTYHDALDMHGSPWFPFVRGQDTGHPPLVSWVLAVLWWLPLPRLWTMHALSWAAGALFLSSVFMIGRAGWGWFTGLGAMVLTLMHPVVYAQVQQLNLDIFMAACSFWALTAAVLGRPRLLAVACALVVFTKLNGMFALGPFMVFAFVGCVFSRRRFDWRWWWSAFWPMAPALGIFAIYHAIKFLSLGHLFDDGTLEGGDQIALVDSLGVFLQRLHHSTHQFLVSDSSIALKQIFTLPSAWLRGGGNLFALLMLLMSAAAFALALFWRSFRERVREQIFQNPAADESDGFWKPLKPWQILALLWLMLIVQLSLQSIRTIWTLVRYFMVCYPVLYLSLLALWRMGMPDRLRRWTLAPVVILVVVFFLKFHPNHLEGLPQRARDVLIYPSPNTSTNYENAPHLLDHLTLVRRAFRYVYRETEGAPAIQAVWPYSEYIREPRFDMLPKEADENPPIRKNPPDAIIQVSLRHFGQTPEEAAAEYPEYRLDRTYQKERIWVSVLFRAKKK
ncbi:MAG: ArnT family glycosyltransferase [Candidatus Sumerlaeota bacterium]